MLYEGLRGQLDASFFDDAFEHRKGRGEAAQRFFPGTVCSVPLSEDPDQRGEHGQALFRTVDSHFSAPPVRNGPAAA